MGPGATRGPLMKTIDLIREWAEEQGLEIKYEYSYILTLRRSFVFWDFFRNRPKLVLAPFGANKVIINVYEKKPTLRFRNWLLPIPLRNRGWCHQELSIARPDFFEILDDLLQ